MLLREVDLCDVVAIPLSERGMQMFSQASGKALNSDINFLAELPTPKSLCRSLGEITDSMVREYQPRSDRSVSSPPPW